MGSNTKKVYLENAFYHVYSRGVNHEQIFKEDADLNYFIYLLQEYLLKLNSLTKGRRKNYYKKIEFLAFCLMPTHLHFLLKQKGKEDMQQFIQSTFGAYTKKFNNKYNRNGYLFQDRYNARLIESTNDLINVSRYIHKNPGEDFLKYEYSSIANYKNSSINRFEFVNEKYISALFKNSKNSYLKFVSVNVNPGLLLTPRC